MKRLSLLAVLALVSCAHVPPAGAATLRVNVTTPALQPDSLCNPIPGFAEAGPLSVSLTVIGPRVPSDSVMTGLPPGATTPKVWQVPSGTYTVIATVRDAFGNPSCGQATIIQTVRGNPGKPVLGWLPASEADLPRYWHELLTRFRG